MRKTLLACALALSALAPTLHAAHAADTAADTAAGARVHVSGPLTRSELGASWRQGCPVGPHSLRRITFNYHTPDHDVARGSIIMSAAAVDDIAVWIEHAFKTGFVVNHVAESSRFYTHGRSPSQADLALMNANTTSAFNCRHVEGSTSWSSHAYGNAIDINPKWNPYVSPRGVQPAAGRPWLHHRRGPGVLTPSIATSLTSRGWTWGGTWTQPDYQHLEKR